MSNWRPKEGWFEKKNEWIARPIPRPFPEREAYEAGADAMLEALKERGEKVAIPWNETLLDKEGVMEKAAHYLGIPLDATCWLVAIPDEEEMGNT